MGKPWMVRQGDVLIERVGEIPDRAVKAKRDKNRIVLAYGESTGHSHAIAERGADLFEVEGLDDRFLKVLAEGGVDLVHEEHDVIAIPKGSYIVRQQRQYFPDAIRRVAD